MKYQCKDCKSIWEEKQIFRVEQFSKSAFCRVCSGKCVPLVDKSELMRFFNVSEEDLTPEDLPPELPKEETPEEDQLESQIKFNYKDSDVIFKPEDEPWDLVLDSLSYMCYNIKKRD